jgi:hypothetical protein
MQNLIVGAKQLLLNLFSIKIPRGDSTCFIDLLLLLHREVLIDLLNTNSKVLVPTSNFQPKIIPALSQVLENKERDKRPIHVENFSPYH